jgi:hypothetical protein
MQIAPATAALANVCLSAMFLGKTAAMTPFVQAAQNSKSYLAPAIILWFFATLVDT